MAANPKHPVMARWRVDYIGKGGKHLGTVEAPDEKAAKGGSASFVFDTSGPLNGPGLSS
jgi:hypothetical protein